MEIGKTKLALTASALAMALMLAGCGGSSSSGGVSSAGTAGGSSGTPSGPTAAQMQTTAITDAIEKAQMAVAAIDHDDPMQDQVTAAKNAVDAATKAIMDAADVEDKSSYEAEVMALENTVTLARTAAARGISLTEAQQAKEAEEAGRKAAEQVNTLFSQANDAETAAMKAGKMATDALATAKKMAGMLDVISVAGNSMTAMKNAQAILDAETDVGKALADAQKALADAMAAQTAANALPADTPNLVSLIGEDGESGEIGEAIKAANDAIDAIEAIQTDKGPTTLAAYVDDVKAGGKGTPTKTGEGVATMIGMALGPTDDSDGSPLRGEHNNSNDPALTLPTKDVATIFVTAPPDADVPEGIEGKTKRVLMHDAPATAMTWKEIVGSTMKRQVDQRTDGGDTRTRTVEIASVAGTADRLIGATLDATAMVNGQETSASWRGIAGTLICAGADCEVESGKLTGSWYFTPSDVDQRYTRAPDSESYTAYNLYATYGYWLSQAAADGAVTVNTFAGQSDDRTLIATGSVTAPESATLAGKATYKGEAVGMSVHKTFNSDSVQTGISSGAFTATVSLEARFGQNASVSGTVSGFKSEDNPDAVDSTWNVRLGGPQDGTAANLSTGSFNNGVTRDATEGRTTKGQNGVWSARTYGVGAVDATNGERPTGIYGGFNAHFSDGHVAGAYATRK